MINQPELETIDSSMTSPPKDVLSYSVSQNPIASELDGDSIDSSIQNALTETASNQSKKTPISIPVQELTPIEKAVNEYAKINNARNKTALNQSLVSASAKDPDTAAKSQALATSLNVSTGVVDFDIELAKRQRLLRQAEAMKLAEKYPSLARSFLNQDFADVAHDDIDNLAKTSDISRRLIATEKSPSDSLPLEFDPIRTANYYATNTLEGFKSDWERGYKSGDITDRSSKLGYSAFTAPGSESRDAYIFQAENLKSKTEEYLGTWTESLAELAGQMAPMTVEAAATGVVASGGAALVASIFPPAELPLVPGAFAAGFAGSMSYQSYEIETGASYLDLRKGDEDYEPMSHEEAAAIAPTIGLINAVLETASNFYFFIPGAKLAKYALKKTVKETVSKSLRKATVGKLARSAAVRVLKTGSLETVTEVLQTIVPKIVREANVPEGRVSAFDTEEGRKRFADEIAVTIEKTFKGAFLLGLIPGGAKFIHERSILNESKNQQEDITNLINIAKESKLNERSKPTYTSYLAQLLSGESIHIGLDQFEQTRKKSEVSLEELEKIIPGITEQVAKAKASGGDVVIPTSLYLSELIDTEFGVSIRNDIRADAEGKSINDIAEDEISRKEFLKELKQEIEDFKKTNKDWAESAGKIEEAVFAKIKAAGNYTEEEARMLAQWHRDTAVVLASRFGMTPEQFNAKFGLSIESAYTPAQQAPAQGSFEQAQIAKMDSDYMAAVESGDVVEQQRMVDEATSSPGWYTAQHGTPTKQKISVFGNRGGLTGAESAKKAFFFSDRSGVTDTYRLFKRGVPNEEVINKWIDGLSPKELMQVRTRDVYFNPDKLNDAEEIADVKEALKEEAGKFNEVEGTNYVIDEIIQNAKNSSVPFPSELDPKNIGQTLKVKLKITNPFYFTQEDAETFGIDAIVTKAIANGHDGIISSERVADSIASPFDDKDPPSGIIYAVFNPEQIKSADPVTRDESGKVVPLSRRFNLSSPNTFEQASRADLGLGQQAAPAPDSGVFDANNPPVSSEAIFALMDADGKIYYDINATMHGDLVETFPNITDTVIDGGFIVNGKYIMGKSDGGYSALEGTGEQIDAVRNFTEQANTQGFQESNYRPAVVAWAKEKFGDRTAPDGSTVWKNFTEWFGDSKVVDAEGKPMVVYHSTSAKQYFEEFKPGYSGVYGRGIYMSSSIESTNVLASGTYNDRNYDNTRIFPLFASIKNPLVVNQTEFQDQVAAAVNITPEELSQKISEGRAVRNDAFPMGLEEKDIYTKLLQDAGFDGVEVQFKNYRDGVPEGQVVESYFVAFEPTQIKSAIGNAGQFSATDPNILRQAAVRQTPMPSVTTTNPISPIGLAIASIPATGPKSIADSNTFFKKVWKKLLIATGKQIRSKSDNSVKEAAKLAVADIQDFLKGNTQFLDYYSQDWIKTKQLLDNYAGRPITNDEFQMYRIISGLTSPNTKLPSNISDTVKLWTHWMNKGSFDDFLLGSKPITKTSVVFESAESVSGTTANVKIRTIKIVADLTKKLGSVKAAIDYLREPVTVKELHAVNKTLGYAGNVSNIGNIRALVQMATGQDILIPRMFIFGQKVGAYALNSIGDERFTTVDIWESRYIRSFFSGMFENEIGLPVDEKEHDTFVRFGYAFKDEMEKVTGRTWTPSSLQALRWFYIIAATRAAGYSKASTSETISTYTNRVLQSTFDYDQSRETNATKSITTPPRRIEPKKYERDIGRDLDAKGITDPKQRQRITAESWIRFARGNSGSDPIGFQFDTDRSGVPRRSGTLSGLATVATHTPGVRLVDALVKAGVSAQPYVELEPTAEGIKAFSDLVRKVNANSKFGTAVYVYSDADYAKKRLFISESGKSGFALSSDGDIVSVFSESGSREGRGAMILATQMGGTKLDCFDTILPVYYAAHGFRAVARVPWSDEFTPAGWDFNAFGQYNGGRPDVVYMVYEERNSKPYSNTDGVVVSNPDEAVAIQTKDIKTEADRAATSKARYAQLVRPPSTEFAQSAQNKPARGFFNPKQLKMMLGSKSDFTTFIHELAHYNLTVLGRIASDPQSPSQIREDMDTTLSWFGIAGETPEQRLANWNAMTLEEQRRHHETFAYNHEIYLSEGKSPSIEMQGVFERFSQFVKRIYISIRDDLNAIYKQEFGTDLPMMTGEIRRVMDRMIATDEQIRSAEERRNMEDTFRDQELSGMDDAQWASYQQMRAEATQKSVSELNEQSLAATTWASRLKAKKVKEIQAEQEELRSEIRKQVKKEVESRNVYRAIKFLKYGILQTAGGEEVEFTGSNKLNANAVKLMVPKENMDKFGSGKNGMVALDGYHPDIVSERFNYSSGDELILAILDAKPMDEVIDGITEDRMEIENGELNSPQAVEAAADKAVHNEARVKLVAVELRWLSKATQPVRAMIAAAKSVAKQMLETKRLRDIKPGDYASAAARAAKESQTAYFASQSAETAAKTAYTRHYNKMIAEGAEEAKAVEMATKVSDEALAKAESRSEAHKKKYGKMKPSEVAAQAKRSQLLQEQLALEANDALDQVKKSLKYLRNVLSDKNVQKIGADNSDQIALLLERFELKNISLKEMDKRTSLARWIEGQVELGLEVDISKELIEQTNKIPYRNLTLSEFNDLVDAVKTIEYMGKNENAILTAAKKAAFKETRDEIVKSIIENAGDRKASTRTPKSGTIGGVTNQVTRFIAAHLKAASVVRILDGGKDDGLLWNYLIRPANKSGDKETTMKATATEAASKILNPFFKSGRMGGKGKFFVSVNESLNREEKLVIALNMGNEGNIQRMLDGYGWTLEQVIPILESMTTEELNAVQEIWDLFGTYKSEISAMSRKIYGKDLDFIEPTPIQIKSSSGETVSLRGGYYPAKYDPMASLAAENYEDAEKGKDLLRAAHISATTSRAYSKQRAEKVVDRPLIRNLSALYSGLNEVIHDLSWREWTIDANKLMRDNAFDKEIRERYGPAFKDQLKSWIKDVAAGEKGMDTDADIALNFLRQGVSSAGLGFNLQSAVLQVTGFNQSIVRVGPKYIGYGIMQVMKRGTGAFREVNELSDFMANRSRTQFRELNELRNQVQGQSAAMKRVRMGTYFLMMKMQRSVDVPTWIGAYAKQLEINPDEQLARDIADQTVIDTQGSGMIKDLSAVERGGAGTKLFTVFYGYMNTVYNNAAVETMTEKKRGKLAAKYVMLFVVPVVLGYALKQLLRPKKDDDDEFDLEQMAKDLSIEQIEYLMGTMVVAREFSQIARTMIDPSAPSMGYSGPAGLRTIKDTYTAATQFGQGEFDSAFRKSAINLIGDISGLPSAQVNRTIDGIEALMEEETTDLRAPLFGVRK